MRLQYRAIEAARLEPGRAIALTIAERCPVACARCRAEPRPTQVDPIDRVVEQVVERATVELVELVGGEPFFEREALALAARRLTAAGKQVVVWTSGIWAARARVPGWIHDVLARCDAVVLTLDRHDPPGVDANALILAAREVTAAQAWLIVEVEDQDGARERAAELLNRAFGGRWDQHAEIIMSERSPANGEAQP